MVSLNLLYLCVEEVVRSSQLAFSCEKHLSQGNQCTLKTLNRQKAKKKLFDIESNLNQSKNKSTTMYVMSYACSQTETVQS